MKYIPLLLIVILLFPGISLAQFATGATESNRQTFLTLNQSTHRNTGMYGYGSGQLELGRTWNVRALNSGGFKLHGLARNEKGISSLLGIEPINGNLHVGSSSLGNKYHYNPGLSAGFELKGNGYNIVIVGKIASSISNLDEKNNEAYTPDYTYTRGYSAYLSGPGLLSAGYNHVWRRDQISHSSNLILFNTLQFGYEDNRREKLYTITMEL